MRIIQTFWTAGKDPMKNAFGWKHPQYNLMSWALSCLSLRALYDEVELYTDSAGYHILIEVLNLPYTKTHIIFDDFQCLPNHWALSKIKTYSLQTEPFLHVDGDIYVPRPLPEELMDAPLAAQNREVGTAYYRKMLDEEILKHPSIVLPEYIEKKIRENSIVSYNMGFFGGTDINFIQCYCREVFNFMDKNQMNDFRTPHAHVNCNVFFEQIFFALFCDSQQREVIGLLRDVRQDKGYTFDEFCELTYYPLQPFFHVLGGHKRNNRIGRLLESRLLMLSPDLYRRILSLFPEQNKRFATETKDTNKEIMSFERCISIYEDWLHTNIEEWKTIPVSTLVERAQMAAQKSDIFLSKDRRADLMINKNPQLKLFYIPKGWNPSASALIKKKLGVEDKFPLNVLACVPTISGKGYCEDAYTQFELDILDTLGQSYLTHTELMDSLHKKDKTKELKAIMDKMAVYEKSVMNLIRKEVLIAK